MAAWPLLAPMGILCRLTYSPSPLGERAPDMNTEEDRVAWAAAVANGDTVLSFTEWVGDKRADEYGLADFLAKLPIDDHPKRVIRALVRDLLASV